MMFSSEVNYYVSNYTAEQKIAITFEQTYTEAKQNRTDQKGYFHQSLPLPPTPDPGVEKCVL